MACQKYIYKLHSSRLRKSRWKLTLPISEARKNDEVISLADSQVLRWIDELNGITDAEEKAREIKAEIKRLKSEPNNAMNRKAVRQLYAKLDSVQFKPDYMCLIIDKEKDYYRACRGFSINGISYKRLLGTNGGIKNSTIVFVSERYADELKRRIDNGRDLNKELVPAKLEAYKALTCSASIPVSHPNGILVVKDCETTFKADTIFLSDEEEGEPKMEHRYGTDIKLDASDGYGLMLPSLAERWSKELGLDYVVSGVNTRYSFEKGMIYTFDFLDFAENVAHNFFVKDVWENTVDIRTVELIFTESMLKLWDSYDSIEDYLSNCDENGYTMGVTKTCPAFLESERTLNYQFIQSYQLDDEDIAELVRPTMEEIRGVLGGDWAKTVLFLRGAGVGETNVDTMEPGFIKAMMVNHEILNDPYVQSTVYQLIRNRIDEAKVGVLKIHGNYSIVSGDPYALCQSIFELPVTGLLKAGEIYNKYWVDAGAERLACFRAPMTCHNNIKILRPCRREDAAYWYRYMTTCSILNAWDTTAAALNGMDNDGDMVMLTDNKVLVERHIDTPTLMCAQRRANKKIVTEEDVIRSNIESFGNDIGKTTNWITSMFEVQSHYKKGSERYEELEYRIRCGQLYQQNVIDKAKGIIAKPMPRSWHDRHATNQIDDDALRRFYRDIVADKKPYFMCYIYPDLMRQYRTYIKNTNRNAMREFQRTIEELRKLPYSELTDRQRDFLYYYDVRMPVGVGDCVMNKICRTFEDAFDGFVGRTAKESNFDYTIMKSGASYSSSQRLAIQKLYDEFNQRMRSYAIFSKLERVDTDDAISAAYGIKEEFRRSCEAICQNELVLCDILLDICYRKSSTKKFVWDMCSGAIVDNLLRKNGFEISVPKLDDSGDIEYCGEHFSIITKTIGVTE